MSINNATPEQWDAAWKAAKSIKDRPSATEWYLAQEQINEAYPWPADRTINYTATPVDVKPVTDGTLDDLKASANPKQAYGDKKVPLHLVPGAASAYIAMGLKEGARKYGAFNWRETDVEVMTYVVATLRHITSFVDGEDTDGESGNPHLAHAMASLAILVDALESEGVIDNRPKAGPAAKTLEGFKND